MPKNSKYNPINELFLLFGINPISSLYIIKLDLVLLP
jgi:hypothetical protein